MNRITVLPGGTDRKVPIENLKNAYFDAKEPREVALTPYIVRRLADGDLVPAPGQDLDVLMPDGGTLKEFLPRPDAASDVKPTSPEPTPKVSQRAAVETGQNGDQRNV